MIGQIEKIVRVAIYSRISVDTNMENEFNSCDAQELACDTYINANKASGWQRVKVYRDGGFSGGTTNRPAFQTMLKAIENDEIDIVVVHRIDRLSRSLADFLQTVQVFEKHYVSFISSSQQINTNSVMGKLMLNVLLSFAQFEREMISLRTKEKLIASRKKGRFTGGRPVKGYDIDRSDSGSKLIINTEEAEQVREIFSLYLENKSLSQTAKELNRLGYTTKKWTTRKNTVQGGKEFDKKRVHSVLTNSTYIGKTKYGDEFFEGIHDAIVESGTWKKTQQLLLQNSRNGGASENNSLQPVLLRGLLYCSNCGHQMGHTYTAKKQVKYRYYACNKVLKQGRQSCISKRVPAQQIEQFIIDQIQDLTQDQQLFLQALEQANLQAGSRSEQLRSESSLLSKKISQTNRNMNTLLKSSDTDSSEVLRHLNNESQQAEARQREIENKLQKLPTKQIDGKDAMEAFQDFDPIWNALSPKKQARVLQLMIERIEYDSTEGKQRISITYHSDETNNVN